MSVSNQFVRMLFLSDSFVDEVEGNIEVPWFCVVVVSDICVDEVEDLVSPSGHEELLLHRDENTMLNYNQRDEVICFVCRRGLIDI